MPTAEPVPSASTDELGQIFSLQRFSLHDGPGIRTTVFLKGCPLTCGWCHNPEGRRYETEIWLLEDRCMVCGACLEECPHPLQPSPDKPPVIDQQQCIHCGACVQVCPTGARQQLGREMSVAGLMAQILRDSPFFEQSGGGVTFSGGEPLLQRRFLRSCRQEGIHTAVDTSGFAPRDQMLELAFWSDLILFDLKLIDNTRHIALTGVPVFPILENLDALDATGAPIWIRLPLIPGLNDDGDNLEALAGFVAGLEHTRRVHVLPYHAHGSDKHARLGRNSRRGCLSPPSSESLGETARLLSGFGLEVSLGG
jgi:pyruvate formate lyase activating enzyme